MGRISNVVMQPNDDEGRTYPGGFLYSYEVGSNTPKALYSDAALTTPLSNPVQADGAGRFFDIFAASGGYRLELRDKNDVVIWSQDDYYATVDGTDIANIEADIDDTQSQIPETFGFYASAGSSNAYTLTITGSRRAPEAMVNGQFVGFRPNFQNTGAATATVNLFSGASSALALKLEDGITDIPSGFLETTSDYLFRYDGTVLRFYSRGGITIPEVINDPINVNGGFDVWQAGKSFTTAGYCADQWKFGLGTGGAATVSRQTFTVGQTDVAGEPTYYLKHNRTTQASDASTVAENIVEDVRTGAGQAVTVSFSAKAGASKTLAVDFLQNFGSGGSADNPTSEQTLTLTTSWQKFTYQFTLPSVSGKTIGAGSYIAARIRETSVFTTFDVDIANLKIEYGTIATDFKKQRLEDVIEECQRYYQKSYEIDVDPGTATTVGALQGLVGNAGSTETYNLQRVFMTRMAAIPTITWYSPTTAVINTININAVQAAVTANLFESQASTGVPQHGATGAANLAAQGHYVADARL